MPDVSIYIIDDHRQFAVQTAKLITSRKGFHVEGLSHSGEAGLAALAAMPCCIALVDMVMPDMGGLEVVRKLRERGDAAKIIVMSLHDSQPYRDSALAAGADAFIAKDKLADNIFSLIRRLSKGAP